MLKDVLLIMRTSFFTGIINRDATPLMFALKISAGKSDIGVRCGGRFAREVEKRAYFGKKRSFLAYYTDYVMIIF